MKKHIPLFASLFLIAACNVSTTTENKTSMSLDSIKIGRETESVAKQFSGLYRKHTSQFLDCESGALYVIKNTNTIDSMYNLILPNAYTDEAIYIEINGSLDTNDPNAILYNNGLKAEQKNYKNTCINSDYWCTGIQPFWIIQISKGEDLIDFYDPMEQKTTHFVYSQPEIKQGVTTYSSTDGENKISVIIKKEKCNGAIDKPYDFSVQVQLNNKKYNGCALQTNVNKIPKPIQ